MASQGKAQLTVIRGGMRRTSWRRKSLGRRALDRRIAEDFLAMPGQASRPSEAWDDLARRSWLYCWWGNLVFRLDEAIDAGFCAERIERPITRLLDYVRARCAARSTEHPLPPATRRRVA